MKNRKNLLLLILAAFLAGNLVIQSCRKDYSPTQSTDDFSSIASDRTDSTNYYKTMVAKCVARGLTDTNFKNFFKRISARWEGNQNGFSLWHYRDSIVSVSQYTSLTLAGFLAYQASQLGYSYNMAFFRGHLVRYIPNLSIGIAIYDTTRVQNYVFTSTLKVADVASTYYSDTTYGGYATSGSRFAKNRHVIYSSIG